MKLEVSKKISEHLEKEAREEIDNVLNAENELLNELSSKFAD